MNPGALSWKQVSVCMHSFQYERENYRCRNVRYGPAYRVRACKYRYSLPLPPALSAEGLAGAAAQHNEHVRPTSWPEVKEPLKQWWPCAKTPREPLEG